MADAGVPFDAGQIPGAKPGETGYAGPVIPPKPAAPLPNVDAVAKNKLKHKNRKRKKHTIQVPLNINLESATNYNLTLFAKSFDGKWRIIETEIDFMAKTGSTTKIVLHKVIESF